MAGYLVELQSLGWFDPDGNPTGEGRRTSVRFVFYRLVARGVIPKSYSGHRTPAQDVSDALRDLR
jgi:hypothetical protein